MSCKDRRRENDDPIRISSPNPWFPTPTPLFSRLLCHPGSNNTSCTTVKMEIFAFLDTLVDGGYWLLKNWTIHPLEPARHLLIISCSERQVKVKSKDLPGLDPRTTSSELDTAKPQQGQNQQGLPLTPFMISATRFQRSHWNRIWQDLCISKRLSVFQRWSRWITTDY